MSTEPLLLKNKTIAFEPLGVLTHEMLEEVYAAPRRMLRLSFDEYGDGIIAGLNFKQSVEGIILTRGIVKLRAEYFYLTSEINLTQMIDAIADKNTVRRYHFTLLPSKSKFEGGVTVNGVELQIVPDNVKGLMELGTFEKGLLAVKLPPTDSKNPLESLEDNFNPIDVPYSFRGGSTFHPYVFKMIRSALARKSEKHFFDCILIVAIDNHAVISLDTLKSYVETCGLEVGDCDRRQLLKKFFEATNKKLPSMTMPIEQKSSAPTPFEDDDDEVLI